MATSERQYEVRQAILYSLQLVYPSGRNTERLMASADVAALRVTREELAAELQVLQAGGFVADLCPGREPYWKIAFAGLKQIRKETALDEIVWGTAAL